MWHFVFMVMRRFVRHDWCRVYLYVQIENDRLLKSPAFPPPLIAQQLLVSGEDHRHALHPGFDSIAICRAIWKRLTSESREGASTIEQQIVRTVTGKYERTIRRKISEIILAILVDCTFDKTILPAVYLSIAYYGWRMNGYLQACKRLNFHPDSLTTDQAAALVSRLKYPEPRVAPISRVRQINKRTKHLLKLYERHVHDGTYRHLESTSFFGKPKTLEPTQPISERRPTPKRSQQWKAVGARDIRETLAERRSSVFIP